MKQVVSLELRENGGVGVHYDPGISQDDPRFDRIAAAVQDLAKAMMPNGDSYLWPDEDEDDQDD